MIYHESDYEAAFISLLTESGWQPINGINIPRETLSEVIYADDTEEFLSRTNSALTPEDIHRIIDTLRTFGGSNDFSALHAIHTLMTDGMKFTPENGITDTIRLIDYDNPGNNIFRAVNQLSVEYVNNGQTSTRRPDILLYVNGIPLCIIELKNPTDDNDMAIHEAWKQIYNRYWRDIPHLLKYCVLACISDGVNTRLGTVRTPYEHFYAWRKVNEDDKISADPFNETLNMIRGALRPERFIEILRDYVYFQDRDYDKEKRVIVCRYPQYFASKRLKKSITESIKNGGGKGGTYFGATGCGKTYAMMFLARQLSMRTKGIDSPTIIMIVDREDLQSQGAKLFTKSGEFLGLGEVATVKSRSHLKQELSVRPSGGFYICTIQKFCDEIGELNTRNNIVCFSDEAHRTQIERAEAIRFSKGNAAYVSSSYAKTLHEAFPKAVFVGFTGTPIQATYDTFGNKVDEYTMDLAVADGLTVPIKYHPRIARVTLDKEKADAIEEYYRQCADDGATLEDIAASKKAQSSMEVIISEEARLERLADDIYSHYTASIDTDPERIQKAMITCSSRKIAFDLLKIFERKYPEWFTEKKCRDGINPPTQEVLQGLEEVPFMAMIASNAPNDKPDMYNYLGGLKNEFRNEKLAAMFKNDYSNFSIAIVVDMWITGFDVPSLKYMYNDKPLKKHILIQTISRVNRRYKDKEYGLIIDYIGIRDNMREAVKLYGGSGNVADSPDDAEKAKKFFAEELIILKRLFSGYDLTPFMDSGIDAVKRYSLLTKAAEYVLSSTEKFSLSKNGGKEVKTVMFREYFTAHVRILRAAYDICQPSGILDDSDSTLAQCFMAVAAIVRKQNGTTEIDTATMDKRVARMVEEALKYSKVESVLETGNDEDIFSPEYMKSLDGIHMPATRLEILVKMLKRAITEYSKTNKIAAKKFAAMLAETIKEYHERRMNAGTDDSAENIIAVITAKIEEIIAGMKIDRESFKAVNLTFEEKAFYDILIYLRDFYGFEYGEDIPASENVRVNEKCRALAQKMKAIIDKPAEFSSWLDNQLVRDQLKFDIKVCLVKNGYPPKYSPEVFRKVMEQVENFKLNN